MDYFQMTNALYNIKEINSIIKYLNKRLELKLFDEFILNVLLVTQWIIHTFIYGLEWIYEFISNNRII